MPLSDQRERHDDDRMEDVHGEGGLGHRPDQPALVIEPLAEPDQNRDDHRQAREAFPDRIRQGDPVQPPGAPLVELAGQRPRATARTGSSSTQTRATQRHRPGLGIGKCHEPIAPIRDGPDREHGNILREVGELQVLRLEIRVHRRQDSHQEGGEPQYQGEERDTTVARHCALFGALRCGED